MKMKSFIFMSCKAGFLLTISLFGQQEVMTSFNEAAGFTSIYHDMTNRNFRKNEITIWSYVFYKKVCDQLFFFLCIKV